MKLINTRLHAGLDYLAGIFITASPWIFQFRGSESASWVMIIIGASMLVMSIFTDYEGDMVRILPMASHLNTDLLIGALMIGSPWIFGFAQIVFIPHLIIGIFIVVVASLTVRKPYTDHSDNSQEKHDENLNRSTPVDSKLTD